MIPLGSITNAGAAADAFDVIMMTIVLGTVGVTLAVNVASTFFDGTAGADLAARSRPCDHGAHDQYRPIS
jgi:hypothetical protein